MKWFSFLVFGVRSAAGWPDNCRTITMIFMLAGENKIKKYLKS